MSWTSFLDAESSLLARRREQRGAPTLGDDADRALLAALAALPTEAHAIAREAGLRVGREVYARRFFEDTLPGAVAVLSASLLESGAGAVVLDHSFHRSAKLRFLPSANLAGARPEVLGHFLAGTVEGFFGSAFNCVARAHAQDDRIHLELGEGRDVNRRKGAIA